MDKLDSRLDFARGKLSSIRDQQEDIRRQIQQTKQMGGGLLSRLKMLKSSALGESSSKSFNTDALKNIYENLNNSHSGSKETIDLYNLLTAFGVTDITAPKQGGAGANTGVLGAASSAASAAASTIPPPPMMTRDMQAKMEIARKQGGASVTAVSAASAPPPPPRPGAPSGGSARGPAPLQRARGVAAASAARAGGRAPRRRNSGRRDAARWLRTSRPSP